MKTHSMLTKEEKTHEDNPNIRGYNSLPILVTGGAGFIGSHTVIELVKAGFTNVIILDNFVNSCAESIHRVKQILKQQNPSIIHYTIDIAKDIQQLDDIIKKHRPYACIHFAGLKAVGESTKKPLLYYQNNLISTTNLVQILSKYECRNLIFSSSATVYGNNPLNSVPITETAQVGVGITNPYGKTKYFIEEILKDYAIANEQRNVRVVLLRYFNPVGAHESGLIGEDPQGIPNNLMPFLSRVAIAQTKKEEDKAFYEKYKVLNVFGNDYDTVDGTGVRDYIHVVDLAKGHVNALMFDIMNTPKKGVSIYNLGTGKGTSVLELKVALQNACGFEIPHVVKGRRTGDIAVLFADCALAAKEIKWTATLSIKDACKDSWNWQSKNPYGFKRQ
eukprot:160529_1